VALSQARILYQNHSGDYPQVILTIPVTCRTLANKPDPVPESFEHVFYSCPLTQALLRNFFKNTQQRNLQRKFFLAVPGLLETKKRTFPSL
jgi:hypothetical protein